MEAYIFDAVRTPRGKGKKDGSLHGVTPLALAATALRAIRDRNGLDTRAVDDVVLGCVEPIGEQGACIGRIAVLAAGYAETTAGVQINRFCASGLEACNMAAAQVMSGQSEMAIGGGVESMSRVPMGSSGGRGPSIRRSRFRAISCRRAYRPTRSRRNGATAVPMSTRTPPRATAARTRRRRRAGSRARSCRCATRTA
ncbi:acetyl-CoA acetyltransferase [Burkholderia mallei SAVP1]|nr:acetyl-CoA acetyltransferase [Burkholderia mallei SAVP1]